MTQYTNQVELLSTTFTDLGAGPLQIGANAVGGFSGIVVVVADAKPSASTPGELLSGTATTPYVYNTTSHVWAKASTGAVTIEVTSVSAAAGTSGGPTTIADGADVTQGTTTDGAWSGAGAGTVVAILKAVSGACASLVTTALGKAARVVLVDPATGNGSLVQAFHNSDNQTIGATSYGLFTGGVDQLINASGTLDRKRAVAGDAMAATGLSSDVPMLFNGTNYDRAYGDKTNGAWVNVKAQPGSAGTDYSANTPSLPNVGGNFGASGPYANYVLVKAIAAAARNNVDVENTSGAQIAIVLDDGTATTGAAPANATVIPLAGGSGVGSQGGSFASPYEKGRLQIYAPSSTAQIAVRVN